MLIISIGDLEESLSYDLCKAMSNVEWFMTFAKLYM